MNPLLVSFDARMKGALDALAQELQGIRTSRASISLLDPLKVEAYGSFVPMSQVGTVSAPDARMLVVQVWDRSMVKPVEKAIRESDLGLNPAVDGQTVRIPMPPLTEERRQELSKVAAKYAEEAKVAVRNVRRDALDSFKKGEKQGELTEDDLRRLTDETQKLTDQRIKAIEELLEKKQKDIKTV